MEIEVKSADCNGNLWPDIKQIRYDVFVVEQMVDEREEYDEFEESSRHFVGLADGKPVATARWRKTKNGYKLERFAVLKAYRGYGVGALILKAVLDEVLPNAQKENLPIYLHAQVHALPFYGRYGFESYGEEFTEADILHRSMRFVKA